ncbi:unnamed protein product [Lathyrus oleraceus]
MLMKLLKNFLMPISKVHQTCIAREIISLLDHPFLPTFYTSFQNELKAVILKNCRTKSGIIVRKGLTFFLLSDCVEKPGEGKVNRT